MSKPIYVKLMPCNRYPGDVRIRLGTITLCESASAWLRETFPYGGTFYNAWLLCPRSDWLGYMLDELSHWADDYQDVDWFATCEELRERYPYSVVEDWIQRLMEGRPEIL